MSWKPDVSEAKKDNPEANVKGQLSKSEKRTDPINNIEKIAETTDKNSDLASVRKDLIKSLIFAFTIIASEVVIYLVWN